MVHLVAALAHPCPERPGPVAERHKAAIRRGDIASHPVGAHHVQAHRAEETHRPLPPDAPSVARDAHLARNASCLQGAAHSLECLGRRRKEIASRLSWPAATLGDAGQRQTVWDTMATSWRPRKVCRSRCDVHQAPNTFTY